MHLQNANTLLLLLAALCYNFWLQHVMLEWQSPPKQSLPPTRAIRAIQKLQEEKNKMHLNLRQLSEYHLHQIA
ncbi:MAG: hypothetical protein RL463_110 [Bacteroidota bacterium]